MGTVMEEIRMPMFDAGWVVALTPVSVAARVFGPVRVSTSSPVREERCGAYVRMGRLVLLLHWRARWPWLAVQAKWL